MSSGPKPWLKGRKQKQLKASNFIKAPPLAAPASAPSQSASGKKQQQQQAQSPKQWQKPNTSRNGRNIVIGTETVQKPSKLQKKDAGVVAAKAAAAARAADLRSGEEAGPSSGEEDDAMDGAEAANPADERNSAAAALSVAHGEPLPGSRKRKISESAALAGLETIPVAQLRAAEAEGVAGSGGEQRWRNKEKVLMLTSRGIPPRHRHLMLDLGQLLPGAKRDAKLDTKSDRAVINEAAELKGCTSAMFFEARKRKDCYLWAAKVPAGPTAKFLIVNVHTMAELKLSGNHLKGSRPVLSFDQTFDNAPHWVLLKEMLSHMFCTPKRHHKSKPFFDHVISFSVADGRIWLRNYQVCPSLEKVKVAGEGANLVEVGPRACLNPILIFSGAFGGPVIWENPGYVSPNDLRAAAKREVAGKYTNKVAKRAARRVHKAQNAIPKGELDDVFK
mmetsp:Transcript_9452/g.28447  ORF Transcript_9452/g.28447 Transcript_9452/m.28447 type:complete len:447 (+) Transcript_9452:201-1541(+)|eukprot:CAMPEP_0206136694 /NCGR_PEP_ID=MMETSP1473-20131121/1935_1 /ASSEMBLY_ACC=CAM_ASM_001109 /TAXON_ID=1461547 /ORGANISM="Stichococcus sp, Strain RCC1054" /LENGTH=446 /DNA_ID=CAMNT_0053529419 /DNA_START=130 /DNA_END=1470 /DNA_ORIENTATION=-